LKSIFGQTPAPSEVVVVDPGSAETQQSEVCSLVMEPVINHQLISTLMIEKTWFHHIPPSESIPVMMLHSISHTKDRTTEVALDCGAQVLSSSRGRAVQMNTGARATKAGFWVKVKQKGMIGYAF